MSSVASVNDASFEQQVLTSEQLVLVDFWAPWCGPCRMLAPVIDEIAESLKDKVKIVKMNVDESPTIPTQFNIRSIPTLILFKDGQAISTKVGPLPKNKLEEWIQEHA